MTDSRPEITVRVDGAMVVVHIEGKVVHPQFFADIPLSSQEARDLGIELVKASLMVPPVLPLLKAWAQACGHEADYDEATIDEAVRLTKERQDREQASKDPSCYTDIKEFAKAAVEWEAKEGSKPETWRDRERLL